MDRAFIADTLGVKPTIDPAEEVKRRVDFLAQYLRASSLRGFVLGVSGGQDSALAGRLAQLAIEQLVQEGYSAELCTLRLPYGRQIDEQDAKRALEFINAEHDIDLNILASTKAICDEFSACLPHSLNDFNRGNVKARIRMVLQYAVAGHYGALVIGTDHAAEALTGFFTKFGDGAADVMPLAGLTKGQGRQLLQHLGAPEAIWNKVPTADLLDDNPGRPDEDELGITYEQIDAFLEGRPVEAEIEQKLIERYRLTEHKRRLPVTPADNWWRS